MQAVVEADGDMAIDNPNSGVVWKYSSHDANGDGKLDFEEQFHRSISTVAIKNDLLFVPDFSGLFHCVDAKTGKAYWTYDMLAAAWGSAMIVGDKVMSATKTATSRSSTSRRKSTIRWPRSTQAVGEIKAGR